MKSSHSFIIFFRSFLCLESPSWLTVDPILFYWSGTTTFDALICIWESSLIITEFLGLERVLRAERGFWVRGAIWFEEPLFWEVELNYYPISSVIKVRGVNHPFLVALAPGSSYFLSMRFFKILRRISLRNGRSLLLLAALVLAFSSFLVD